MKVLHMTSKKRETYHIEIKSSLLWECAFGIAAFTNEPLLHTLNKPQHEWKQHTQTFPKRLLKNLDKVAKHNTWKSLLQILHQGDFPDIPSFKKYIMDSPANKFKLEIIPFIGQAHQEDRICAAKGDSSARTRLMEAAKENPFFPSYIEYVCSSDTDELKPHLCEVMEDWHQHFIMPQEDTIDSILRTDAESKKKMLHSKQPEELVEWATGGIQYHAEPSVHRCLLIPHYIYRPWNIEADLEGTKVFYYPIADESIDSGDRYQPSSQLVNKYKALGDETRLRIVKMLADGPMTLKELTAELSLGKSTIHHHLKLLKSARIVREQKSNYELNIQTIEATPLEMDRFLKN
ncbi:ArsR/SmtB family transcription factor [Falsibacillus albus]|uniref:ArsR family transcriptional regulator n=1 Tax=Falsibacillus albus TaxID=2478915 RepID=A0A3L7JW57_9BACI|nr:metalloregulator ArsR/SmtB family transcription factor [Falsibacillus albus]RLQ94349.1 ArsR family transcriptional regulator [Falsibacillus albus]